MITTLRRCSQKKNNEYTGWPQSHAPMLIKKVIVVTFIQIQSSLQGLQMLDMFAVCSYARANTKFKVPVDTIQ